MPLTSQDGTTDIQVGDFVAMEWRVARLFEGVPVVLLERQGSDGQDAASPQVVTERVCVSEASLTLVPPDTLQEGARVTLTWQVVQVYPETGTVLAARRGLGGTLASPTPVTILAGARAADLPIVPADTVGTRRVGLPFAYGQKSGALAQPDMLPFGFAPLEEGEPDLPPPETPLALVALVPPTAQLGTPSFTLHATGTGFAPGASIIWNGAPEPTVFVSPEELTTGVDMTTAAVPITVGVAVRQADGALSNSLPFTFTPAA